MENGKSIEILTTFIDKKGAKLFNEDDNQR